MRCEQVKALLNDYLEGALSPAVVPSLEAHLSVCASCRGEWQFRRGIWRSLAQLFGSSSRSGSTSSLPVESGIRLEWRDVGEGERVPVLRAALNREASAMLAWSPEPNLPPRQAQRIWQGTLQPGKAVEIPLPLLHQKQTARAAATLWWTVDDQHRAFFIPTGYPPSARASLRLRAHLSEALALLAETYQTPIEWLPASHETNPLVVLDVRDATLPETLQQLLIGTRYTARAEKGHWRILPQ
jgi:hypothetical protein